MAEKKTERQRKKEVAQYFYCHTQLSQKEISEKVGVSEVTISRWVNKENWDTLKSSVTITRQEQITRTYNQIAAVNKRIAEEQNGIPTNADADLLTKLANVIDKLERETSISETVNVSIQFLEWIRKVDTDKAKELSAYFDNYIKHLLN